MSRKRVALLMSGGVDSSYCAYLLKQHYEVIGIYLRLHGNDEKNDFYINKCQEVSKRLEIKFHTIDLRNEFKNMIYDYFINSYKEAKTPNPCALCNPNIKFGLGLKKALEFEADFIATGHYARIEMIDGIPYIKEALDKSKDQSYFLFGISLEAKKRLIFPLGNKFKTEIKPLAFSAMPWFGELESYSDSQEICFVDKDYISTIRKDVHDIDKQGIIKNTKGEIVGEHKGYMQYTVGKRRGINVRGAHNPNYVLSINPSDNSLIVGDREELARDEILASILSLDNFKGGRYKVRARYRSEGSYANVELRDGKIVAKLEEKIYGVANGQALVIYKDDIVLGGGFIENSRLG